MTNWLITYETSEDNVTWTKEPTMETWDSSPEEWRKMVTERTKFHYRITFVHKVEADDQ